MTDHPATGIPGTIRACLFDLDGVLTPTAAMHAAAWKQMFDAFLKTYADQHGQTFVPFDPKDDYDTYVDGRIRDDGTRAFLESRHIDLPLGTEDDGPDAETIRSLGTKKNALFLAKVKAGHLEPYEGSVRYLHAVKAAGLARAVVSASANCKDILDATGLADLVDVRVDGLTAAAEHLAGKPKPDTYLAAARKLGVDPAQAAVYEDALSGVEAGKAGRFGFVVGVNRVGQADALRQHGADTVVDDLGDLLGTS
jgi:beta-phosphoglucomutase family hydrolase